MGVGVAVGMYGFAFGAASIAAGLSVLQTCLLSLFAFTGGTQFAVVGVLAGGGTLAEAHRGEGVARTEQQATGQRRGPGAPQGGSSL